MITHLSQFASNNELNSWYDDDGELKEEKIIDLLPLEEINYKIQWNVKQTETLNLFRGQGQENAE